MPLLQPARALSLSLNGIMPSERRFGAVREFPLTKSSQSFNDDFGVPLFVRDAPRMRIP